MIVETVDVGAVRVKGASLGIFAGTVSAPSVLTALLTVSVAVILSLVKRPFAAWVAVMVVVPTPAIVTTPPDVTVATAVLLLVYVNAPLLSVTGAVMLNDASPNVFAGILNAPNLYCNAIPLEKRPSPPYRL